MNKAVKDLQTLIVQAGYLISVDGIFGQQTSRGVDQLNVPEWIKVAMKEVGTSEIRGKNHNDRVLEYHATTMGKYDNDEVAWCGSFVNWVFRQVGIKTVSIPERAKSWIDFGKKADCSVLGCIAVKNRAKGGHVCFVVGKDSVGNLYCLGGNQNDEVNIKLYKKDDFIDFRVPLDYDIDSLPYYALANARGTIREA